MNKVKCNYISLIFIVFMSFWIPSLQADTQVNNDNTYLKVARDQLSLAFDKYKAGDISAAKKSLRKASDWLNKAVAHSEYDKVKVDAEKLASEIDRFRSTLSHSSEQNDIARFWHQATSILMSQSEQLIHSYITSSNDNTTLRHLLDAKSHFYLAEHDLFVSHDLNDALLELNNSLSFLAKADKIAKPKISARVKKLTTDINALVSLTESSNGSWRKNKLIASLDKALKNVTHAESIATPPVKIRLKAIERKIYHLKSDMQKSSIKAKYDSIMSDFTRTIKSI